MQQAAGQPTGPRSGRLAGPVDVTLARAADTIPQRIGDSDVLFGLKFDGYRASVVRGQKSARIWSRQGTDMSAASPRSSKRRSISCRRDAFWTVKLSSSIPPRDARASGYWAVA